MDPMVTMNEACNMAAEIWPFPANNSSSSTYINFVTAANMNININVDVRNANENRERDPMVLDHGSSIAGTKDEATVNSDGDEMENKSKRLKSDAGEGNVSEKQAGGPLKQDYIHVRARRGEATDSHSLAERARREKISERMKILQDLVPGCSKVIGKALVLDEIINYIQSLQRQVEFLSMKLEALNSRANGDIEPFLSKEFGQQAFDTSGLAFSSQPTRSYGSTTSPEWLHMQLRGGFGRTT